MKIQVSPCLYVHLNDDEYKRKKEKKISDLFQNSFKEEHIFFLVKFLTHLFDRGFRSI